MSITLTTPLRSYNCAGFAFGTQKWEDLWSKSDFDEAYKTYRAERDQHPEYSDEDLYNIEVAAILDILAARCEQHFNCKRITLTSISSAPIGTIAMRIQHNTLSSDYHFAIKEIVAGESCWLHKPGKGAIDMMFDEDIVASEWPNGYDSSIVYFIKEV